MDSISKSEKDLKQICMINSSNEFSRDKISLFGVILDSSDTNYEDYCFTKVKIVDDNFNFTKV